MKTLQHAFYLALSLPILSAMLLAEETTPHATPTGPEAAEEHNSGIESLNLTDSHYAISMALGDTAKRLDAFFGDERYDEEVATSQLRVGAGVEAREAEGIRFLQRVRLSLEIPKTSERVQLLIDGLNEDSDEDRDEITLAEDDATLSSALRFIVTKSKRTAISIDGGMKLRPAPDPFVTTRWRRIFELGDWKLRPAQFLFWRREIGFGETSRVDLEHLFSKQAFFRGTTEATWSEESEGVDLLARLQQYFSLGSEEVVVFEVRATGHTRPSAVVDEYLSRIRLRTLLYRKWLFLELTPGLRFERDRSYSMAPFFGVLFEVLFSPESAVPWTTQKPKEHRATPHDE